MGRAYGMRGAVATGRFEDVFGARRGSALTLTQRDLQERAEGMRTWREELREHGFDEHVADLLMSSYEGGEESSQVMARLREDVETDKFATDELTYICGLGDPVGYPGLSAPAVEFMGEYLAALAHSALDTARSRDGIRYAFDICFPLGDDGEHCLGMMRLQRLRPLIEGLGEVIGDANEETWKELRSRISIVLDRADKDVLAGPLRSWEQALAHQEQKGRLDLDDQASLERLRAAIDSAAVGPGARGRYGRAVS